MSESWLGVPATIVAKTDRILGTGIRQGTVLLRCQRETAYPMLDRPDEFCEIVAEWRSEQVERSNWNLRYVAAMVHPYGKGWVYWQSVVEEPNYPKLKELFRAGIWRAATGRNMIANLPSPREESER
jgi:hypothetical protein